MKDKSAVIIIDTGFSLASLLSAKKILAVLNVATGSVVTGSPDSPYLSVETDAGVLEKFAFDPLNHGSLVLDSLTAVAPELPVVLVRAYSDDVKLIRTEFAGSRQLRPGWTEAYLAAVNLCRGWGLASAANLSFGGYTHACDGSGWESHCLAQVTGPGKPGHVVIAGAGAGNGAALHASWKVAPGGVEEITALQSEPTTYNFWCAADAAAPESIDWLLEVTLNGRKVAQELSRNLLPNLWNNRKQVNFRVQGAGKVRIRTSRAWNAGAAGGVVPSLAALAAAGSKLDPQRFDCWIDRDTAHFLDHVDPLAIAEPAIFPHVIAAGLAAGEYAPDQKNDGAKPEVLLPGKGPISFRLPELTAEVARMLANDPALDVVAVRKLLGNRKAA